jgi:Fe(3+) dicitrate transport protein
MKIQNRSFSPKQPLLAGTALVACVIQSVYGQSTNTTTKADQKLPDVVIRGESQADDIVQGPFMPAVEGTKIYSGKKTSVIDLDAMPQIQTDNYRQAFSKTPGLLTTELSNPSLLSLGYRGIGDPHETQNLLVTKDGIPFVVDMLGYPTVYYAPPFESLDRFEFIRGGGSLMYGPQPSGVLNYVTHMPRTDKEFGFHSQHIFGSDSLYSTYNQVDGTIGRLGYLAFFDHRQGDSFRDANSDYEINGGAFKMVLDAQGPTRWIFNMDAYSADSGEPGGLTFGTGPRDLNYNFDRDQTQNFFDRVRVERYVPSLSLDHSLSDQTALSAKIWGGYYSRYSKRQDGSGFGRRPTGTSNTINLHEYYSYGSDVRLRHYWNAWDNEHVLTGGFTSYYVDSPISNRKGASAGAEDGPYTFRADRESLYGAIFAENRFSFGKLSVTPGLRLESIDQSIQEELNTSKTGAGTPLGNRSDEDFVPLFGLGTEYQLTDKTQLYGNFSQGYKPKTYADAVPTGANDRVNADLDPGESFTVELGYRGTPTPWAIYDASVFYIDYDNRFGKVGNLIQNVGRSVNMGIDFAAEADMVGLVDSFRGTDYSQTYGSLSIYGNTSILEAEFMSGPQQGKVPQYAPDYIVRTGLIYRKAQRAKVALLGTFVDNHWANDNNGLFDTSNPASSGYIPGYMVWDLTAEVNVYRDNVRILAGINNLFNEDYYSRIRSNGIDPAYGRNFYAGLAFSW